MVAPTALKEFDAQAEKRIKSLKRKAHFITIFIPILAAIGYFAVHAYVENALIEGSYFLGGVIAISIWFHFDFYLPVIKMSEKATSISHYHEEILSNIKRKFLPGDLADNLEKMIENKLLEDDEMLEEKRKTKKKSF